MPYTMREGNIIYLAKEFSGDPCERTLHNLVALAQMNDMRGWAVYNVDERGISDEWVEKLFARLWPPEEVEERLKPGGTKW